MTAQRSRVTLDEVYAAIGSLVDHIKVLVTAVDDLRCEIEWQARNQDEEGRVTAPTPVPESLNSDFESSEQTPGNTVSFDSLLTASGRLQAFEKLLYQAPRGLWLDEFASEDELILPEGRIFSVDADLWTSVRDIRPAHVVGDN
jgi:hypothetical protein